MTQDNDGKKDSEALRKDKRSSGRQLKQETVELLLRENERLREAQVKLLAHNQQLEIRARYDFLTEVFNRRGLAEALERAAASSKRQGVTLSALLIDCDEFKNVNDTFGHSVGDAVLKDMAARLKQSVRPTDSVGRIGGDEFLVLLPGTTVSELKVLAERLRVAIADGTFSKQPAIDLSVSMGASVVPDGQASLEQVISLTQDELKRSKTRGRNRVSVREDSDSEPPQ